MNAPHRTAPLLDLDLLRTLVAIADSGSFSAAAAMVLRTPSAISMQVKKIEEMLGRPVFNRDSRSVTLTPDGVYLLEHARRMLALNREAVARFVEPDLKGVVRVGVPDDVAERFLPDMLRRFADAYPGVTVDVVVEGTDFMLRAFRAGSLDMALVNCEEGHDGVEAGEVLLREQLVWAMCRCGVAVEREPLPVSVWDEGCSWRRAAVEGLEAQGRSWRVAFQSAHISGQRAAILADLAVAPVPASALGEDFIEVPAKYGLPRLPVSALALVIGDTPSPAVAAAADHLRASFAAAGRKDGQRCS